MTEEKDKFPDRIVLGEGYPWAFGTGTDNNPHDTICLNKDSSIGNPIPLNFPKFLWKKTLPKYRLVLERVD